MGSGNCLFNGFSYDDYIRIFHILDVEDLRYKLVQEILSIFNPDYNIDNTKNFTIFLDLASATNPTKRISITPVADKPNWTTQVYQDKWLTLEGYFLNKSSFLLTVTEITQITGGWKPPINKKDQGYYDSNTDFHAYQINLDVKYLQKKYDTTTELNQNEDSQYLPLIIKNQETLINQQIIIKNQAITDKLEHLSRIIKEMFISLKMIS